MVSAAVGSPDSSRALVQPLWPVLEGVSAGASSLTSPPRGCALDLALAAKPHEKVDLGSPASSAPAASAGIAAVVAPRSHAQLEKSRGALSSFRERLALTSERVERVFRSTAEVQARLSSQEERLEALNAVFSSDERQEPSPSVSSRPFPSYRAAAPQDDPHRTLEQRFDQVKACLMHLRQQQDASGRSTASLSAYVRQIEQKVQDLALQLACGSKEVKREEVVTKEELLSVTESIMTELLQLSDLAVSGKQAASDAVEARREVERLVEEVSYLKSRQTMPAVAPPRQEPVLQNGKAAALERSIANGQRECIEAVEELRRELAQAVADGERAASEGQRATQEAATANAAVASLREEFAHIAVAVLGEDASSEAGGLTGETRDLEPEFAGMRSAEGVGEGTLRTQMFSIATPLPPGQEASSSMLSLRSPVASPGGSPGRGLGYSARRPWRPAEVAPLFQAALTAAVEPLRQAVVHLADGLDSGLGLGAPDAAALKAITAARTACEKAAAAMEEQRYSLPPGSPSCSSTLPVWRLSSSTAVTAAAGAAAPSHMEKAVGHLQSAVDSLEDRLRTLAANAGAPDTKGLVSHGELSEAIAKVQTSLAFIENRLQGFLETSGRWVSKDALAEAVNGLRSEMRMPEHWEELRGRLEQLEGQDAISGVNSRLLRLEMCGWESVEKRLGVLEGHGLDDILSRLVELEAAQRRDVSPRLAALEDAAAALGHSCEASRASAIDWQEQKGKLEGLLDEFDGLRHLNLQKAVKQLSSLEDRLDDDVHIRLQTLEARDWDDALGRLRKLEGLQHFEERLVKLEHKNSEDPACSVEALQMRLQIFEEDGGEVLGGRLRVAEFGVAELRGSASELRTEVEALAASLRQELREAMKTCQAETQTAFSQFQADWKSDFDEEAKRIQEKLKKALHDDIAATKKGSASTDGGDDDELLVAHSSAGLGCCDVVRVSAKGEKMRHHEDSGELDRRLGHCVKQVADAVEIIEARLAALDARVETVQCELESKPSGACEQPAMELQLSCASPLLEQQQMLAKDLETVRNELAALAESHEQARASQQVAAGDLEGMRSQLAALAETEEQARTSQQAVVGDLEGMRGKLAALTETHEQAHTAQQALFDERASQVDSVIAIVESFSKRLASCEGTISQELRCGLEGLTRSFDEQRNRLGHLKEAVDASGTAEGGYEVLRSSLDYLTDKLEELKEKHRRLESRLEDVAQAGGDHEDLRRSLCEITAKLEEQRDKRLQDRREDVGMAADTYQAMRVSLQDLSERLDEQGVRQQALEDAVAKQRDIDGSELEEMRSALTKQAGKLEEEACQLPRLRTELQQTNERMNDQASRLEQLESSVEQGSVDAKHLRSEISASHDRLASRLDNLEIALRGVEDVGRTVRSFSEKFAEQKEEQYRTEAVLQNVVSLTSDYEAVRSRLSEVTEEVLEHKVRLGELFSVPALLDEQKEHQAKLESRLEGISISASTCDTLLESVKHVAQQLDTQKECHTALEKSVEERCRAAAQPLCEGLDGSLSNLWQKVDGLQEHLETNSREVRHQLEDSLQKRGSVEADNLELRRDMQTLTDKLDKQMPQFRSELLGLMEAALDDKLADIGERFTKFERSVLELTTYEIGESSAEMKNHLQHMNDQLRKWEEDGKRAICSLETSVVEVKQVQQELCEAQGSAEDTSKELESIAARLNQMEEFQATAAASDLQGARQVAERLETLQQQYGTLQRAVENIAHDSKTQGQDASTELSDHVSGLERTASGHSEMHADLRTQLQAATRAVDERCAGAEKHLEEAAKQLELKLRSMLQERDQDAAAGSPPELLGLQTSLQALTQRFSDAEASSHRQEEIQLQVSALAALEDASHVLVRSDPQSHTEATAKEMEGLNRDIAGINDRVATCEKLAVGHAQLEEQVNRLARHVMAFAEKMDKDEANGASLLLDGKLDGLSDRLARCETAMEKSAVAEACQELREQVAKLVTRVAQLDEGDAHAAASRSSEDKTSLATVAKDAEGAADNDEGKYAELVERVATSEEALAALETIPDRHKRLSERVGSLETQNLDINNVLGRDGELTGLIERLCACEDVLRGDDEAKTAGLMKRMNDCESACKELVSSRANGTTAPPTPGSRHEATPSLSIAAPATPQANGAGMRSPGLESSFWSIGGDTPRGSVANESLPAAVEEMDLAAAVSALRWGNAGNKFKAVANYLASIATSNGTQRITKRAMPAEYLGRTLKEDVLLDALEDFPEDLAKFFAAPEEVTRLPELAAIGKKVRERSRAKMPALKATLRHAGTILDIGERVSLGSVEDFINDGAA
eukprot:TRINITY_DN50885_c0_g1_i3.p1 TRINITY_DN50885_c0_g1~~TRINITY_DN50885_c0_g1_i3.p1  ORF type:complete len:2312 (+),score=648.83 TRINITY_DN50885_c0_g1_i3:83-7018(+)